MSFKMPKLIISQQLPILGNRICSIGNRGHHNFGDELILIGLMRLIMWDTKNANETKNAQLFISWWDIPFLKKFHRYFLNEQELTKVRYIQEIPHGIRSWLRFLFGRIIGGRNHTSGGRMAMRPYEMIKNYLSCDTFIIWGWELFTEETPGSYLYWFWSLIPFWIRKLFFWNTKLYIMGGFQKPKSWYNMWIVKLILRYADGCFMRDEESVEILNSKLWIKNCSKAKWFIDTSYFALDILRDNGHPKRSSLQFNWKHIIINSNPLSGKRTDELITIAKEYIDKWYDVYFLPAFYTKNPQQDDMKVYEYVKNAIVGMQFFASELHLLDRRSRDEFLIIFNSAEKVFCSRLHVFLIAAFLGIDVHPYAYQKKIDKNMAILRKCWIMK